MLNVGGDSIFGGALSKPMSAKSTKSIFSFGTFSNQSSNLLDRYTKMYQNKFKLYKITLSKFTIWVIC